MPEKLTCVHCQSSNLRCHAQTLAQFHVLFQCRDCQKLTEYSFSGQSRVKAYLGVLLSFLAVFVPPVFFQLADSAWLIYYWVLILPLLYLSWRSWTKTALSDPAARDAVPQGRGFILVQPQYRRLALVLLIALVLGIWLFIKISG